MISNLGVVDVSQLNLSRLMRSKAESEEPHQSIHSIDGGSQQRPVYEGGPSLRDRATQCREDHVADNHEHNGRNQASQ